MQKVENTRPQALTRQTDSHFYRWRAVVLPWAGGLAIGGGLLLAAWLAIDSLPETTAKILLLVVLVVVPFLVWAAHRLGQTEARSAMVGLNVGVQSVMDAANRTVEVKTHARRRLTAAPSHDAPVALPPPDFAIRRADEGAFIEM